MIDWTPLTRAVLDALAAGPMSLNTEIRLARVEIYRVGDIDRRTFAFELLKEEPTWRDRGRASRARRALREPLLVDMLAIVVSLKILELADEIGRMTGHERIALLRQLSAAPANMA